VLEDELEEFDEDVEEPQAVSAGITAADAAAIVKPEMN
jgi:hypothetical protein